jgi:hypothetical protein
MSPFKFLRCYFLYLYYWLTIKPAEKENRKPSRFSGFCIVMGAFLIVFMGVWTFASSMFPETTSAFYNWLVDVFGKTETHKGTVSIGFFLFMMPLTTLICYLVCCFRIPFEEIPERLQRHSFLSEFSWYKVLAPYFLPLPAYLIYLLFA